MMISQTWSQWWHRCTDDLDAAQKSHHQPWRHRSWRHHNLPITKKSQPLIWRASAYAVLSVQSVNRNCTLWLNGIALRVKSI